MFFVLCFIKTQPFVKRKPVKTEKIPERSRSVLGRFYCITKYSHRNQKQNIIHARGSSFFSLLNPKFR